MQLSRAEKRFVVAARTGEALALGNDTPTKALAAHRIRATVIRRLLLGDPLLPDDTESSARAPHVLDLTGAWIDGRLDLRDMRAADGGSGPTIRLKACVVPKGIALTSGHFSELSLLDCRFPELLADGALFDGLVDLSGSASTEVDAACTGCARPDDDGEPRPQGRCHISLTGAMINGDVKTSNARLCAPPRDPDFDVTGGGRPYALKLNGARVSGGLIMQPGLVALGGIDIGNAEIGGSVWLQGAHLTAEWSLAFNAQMARIRGGVALSALFRDDKPAHPFISEGCVNLYGALIEGELYMQGAKLRAGPDGVALSGFQARIEKMVRVSVALDEKARVSSVPFEAKGQVDFSNSVLGGFNAGGAVFDGGGKAALLLNGAQITGETRLESAQGLQVETSSGEVIVRRIIHRCLVRGMIQASKASLDQGVWIAGVRLEGGEGFGLDLLETRIGRSFHLRAFEGPDEPAPGVTRMVTLRTEIDGGLLRLDGSEIDGEFHIRGAVIGNGQQAILARAVKVGDRLVLSELNAKGTLIFNAAKIVNEVLIEDLVSSPPDQAATLDLDNSQIGGSFFLRRFEAPGPIRASFAQIGGEVLIAGCFTGPGLALTLESARISGNLNLDLATSAMVKLDYVTVGGLATVHQFAASSRLETSIQLSADGAHFDGGLELKPNCVSLDSFPRFGDVRGLRATDAVFYPGWQVVEAFVLTPAESGIFTLLWDGVRRSTPLNGLGDVITRFNASGAARLILTEDTVFAYAAFHLANGWADRGAVRLLSDTADLDAYGMKLRDPEAPFKSVTRLDDGVWRLEGPAEYNDRLFATVVEVRADGEVTITQNQLLTDQSVIKRRFARPLRKGAAGSDPLSMRILSELDPARPWPVRTQTTQTWEDLADHVDRTVRAIGALRSDTETSTGAPNGARLIAALSVRRVRLQALNCYPGWFLAQGLIDGPKGQGVIGWLWDGDSRGVLLNGKSDPIHRFNLDQPPHLETDEQVFTYVRLFCAYVWAEEGAFIVIDDAEELPFPEDEREDRAGAVRPMRVTGRGAKIKVEATICYGDTLFYSLFEIHPTGFVEMMQDEKVEVPPGQVRIAHDFPFITPLPPIPNPPFAAAPSPWPDTPALAGDWTILDKARTEAFATALQTHQASERVPVYLAGAHADFIEDSFGENWGGRVTLDLSGFTYDQIDRVPQVAAARDTVRPASINLAERRRDWLALQFGGVTPARSADFDSQPHAQLASVYRRSGRTDEAREIVHDKMRIESRLKVADFRQRVMSNPWTGRATVAAVSLAAGALACAVASLAGLQGAAPVGTASLGLAAMVGGVLATLLLGPGMVNVIYRMGFGYGLYSRNALTTFAVCILVGWIGVSVANKQQIGPSALIDFRRLDQVMTMEVATVNDVLVTTGKPERPLTPATRRVQSKDASSGPLACGAEIDPLLYAIDLFIPLIDLRQEAKCSPTGGPHAAAWQLSKAIYALLGWIITSLTILTVSGVLQSRSEH